MTIAIDLYDERRVFFHACHDSLIYTTHIISTFKTFSKTILQVPHHIVNFFLISTKRTFHSIEAVVEKSTNVWWFLPAQTYLRHSKTCSDLLISGVSSVIILTGSLLMTLFAIFCWTMSDAIAINSFGSLYCRCPLLMCLKLAVKSILQPWQIFATNVKRIEKVAPYWCGKHPKNATCFLRVLSRVSFVEHWAGDSDNAGCCQLSPCELY